MARDMDIVQASKLLNLEDKVPIIISGETGKPWRCLINGLPIAIPRNVVVEVPRSVIQLIEANERVTTMSKAAYAPFTKGKGVNITNVKVEG